MTLSPTEQTQIRAAIFNATNDELNDIITQIKRRRSQLTEQVSWTFNVNDMVRFDRGARRGGWVTGKVTKVNRKTVKVKVSGGATTVNWTVSPRLLEAV